MTGTEKEVFEIIFKRKKISLFEISKEIKFGLDYLRLICQELQRKNLINFAKGWCSLEEEKKVFLKKKTSKPRGKDTSLLDKENFRKEIKNLKKLEVLLEARYKSWRDLAKAPLPRLMEETGFSLKEAANLINKARERLKYLPGE